MGGRLALAAFLAACLVGCGEAVPDRDVVERQMAQSLTETVDDHGYPLILTQAEFQDGDEGLWWITQFMDPAQSPAVGMASTEELVFEYPLEGLVAAVRENDDDLRAVGTQVFIIAFRGDSTVYEIDAELMWEFAEGDLAWREVTDRMLISG